MESPPRGSAPIPDDGVPSPRLVPVALRSSWVAPDACTLPTTEQPVRVAELDALFVEELTRVERLTADRIRLSFRAADGVRGRVADVVRRESACCSFFDFTVDAVGSRVTLEVSVPPDRRDVLVALEQRACEALATSGSAATGGA